MPETLETMIVAEVMNQWPETVPVFVRRRMACPGCVMAPFMTVADASKEYGLDVKTFTSELSAEIQRMKKVASCG